MTSIGIADETAPTFDDNKMTITHSFKQPILSSHQLYEQKFSDIQMAGTYTRGMQPGDPVVSVRPVSILLPQDKAYESLSVTTTSNAITVTSDIDLQETPIKPYQRAIPFGFEAPESISFNQDTYSARTTLPSQIYDNVAINYCRGYPILTFNLYPTQYNPHDGVLSYYPNIEITVNLKDETNVNEFYRGSSFDSSWVSNLVDNPEVLQTYTTRGQQTRYDGGLCDPSDNGGLGYDYVVITRSSLTDLTGQANTWDDFISRKNAEGLETTIVAVEDITACSDYYNSTSLFNDSQAQIREFLRDAYQDWGLEYVLIAGDHDGSAAIPRRLMDAIYEGSIETDIYWSNLDNDFNADQDSKWGEYQDAGFDLYSELFIGTLPCDEAVDLSNWMQKSFYYADSQDKEYLDNSAFYGGDTGWSCQGDDFLDFTIYGTDMWLGPDPDHDGPWPSFLGFLFGFDTWNATYPGMEYDNEILWTAEPTNPGWQGGSETAAINGLKSDISSDNVTLLFGIAHANSAMSLDVGSSSWEADYHNTKPFFIHDYGCHCGDMSASDDGVLHSMLFHDDTELAFATIMNTCYGWGNLDCTNSSSALQQKLFVDFMFNTSKSGGTSNWRLGVIQGYTKDAMAPTIDWDTADGTWRAIIQGCLLFGDPAQLLKPPTIPEHNIGITDLDVAGYVVPDQPVTIDVSVLNNGNNTETDIEVKLLIDDIELDSQTIASLDTQSSDMVSFTWTPTVGVYEVKANISIPGVTEDIYLDNERSSTVVAGPEITVTGLLAPGIAGKNFETNISATINNIGVSNEDVTVDFKVDSTIIDSTIISLSSGSSSTQTFTWIPDVLGNHTISIEASVSSTEPVTSNNEKSAVVQVMSAVFVDAFEDGASGWTTDTSTLWHLTTNDANSPTHSFWCGDDTLGTYSDSMSDSLYSPIINLTDYEDATLSFWQWYDIEDGYSHYDGGNLKISTDGGSSWNLLGSYQNPYPVSSASSGNSGISGEPCFTGTTAGWEEVFFDLTSYVGQEVMLRWHFGSDGSVKKTGWLIDDILIYGSSVGPEISNLDATPNPQETGGNVNITCEINSDYPINSSSVDISGPLGNETHPLTPNGAIYYFEQSYATSGEYTYSITAEDSEGNIVTSPSESFTIGIPPVIVDLLATPAVQSSGGPVNITCTVSDNGVVSSVELQVMQPDSSVVSVAMIPLGGGMYYYNQSYSQMGVYSVSVTAADEHGNIKVATTSFGIGTISVDFDLEAGWNFIGIPFQTNQMASDLILDIPGCQMISMFNATTQGYDTYFYGGPSSFDFALVGGRSYFVLVDASVSISLSGTPVAGVSIPLELGWNAITWCESNPTLASTIGGSITGAEMISWFNAVSQGYETYFVGGPSSFDFTVEMGKGLFVLVNQESTWTG